MTDSVCQQYDAVSTSLEFSPDSVSSFQMMKLLIPHLKNLRKVLYSIAHILFGVMTYLLQLGHEKCHNDYSQHRQACMTEPHTSGTGLQGCMCMFVCGHTL